MSAAGPCDKAGRAFGQMDFGKAFFSAQGAAGQVFFRICGYARRVRYNG